MSYTKFSKEVTKWLKANNLPCYGTAYESPEETKARLDAWMVGMKHMLRQWIAEKRYRELISCAHGGWYTDDVIFEPLAEHFVENHLFDELRFLCERGIRFSIKDMLSCIKTEKEEHGTLDVKTVQGIDVNAYMAGRGYWQLGEIAKYRMRALNQLDRYLKYLTRIQASQEYTNTISAIEKSVFDLTIKAKDLKQIKFKL
ncbi:hypothetical protein [Anaerotignum sp.]|uniref:hypothetical protein n=1 Tax=Anaerotignum sp. TaxID=2039241 RepID=UPI0037363C57